jgi:hypothetical protein
MLLNKKNILFPVFLSVLTIIFSYPSFSQNEEVLMGVDSTKTITAVIDSSSPGKEKIKKVKVYNPKKAALRSAIIPGWGQVYNEKYWKVPIVYAALGVTGGIFLYNLKNYKETRFAYQAKYRASLPGATPADSAELLKIKPHLQPLSKESLQYYRDSFRRDIDYSAVVFILLWGLNVVDAAVDSHLKAFDVSPDLSLQIKPGHSEMAGTNGISLVLNIGKNQYKQPATPVRF